MFVCAWSAPEARSAEGDGAASAAPSAKPPLVYNQAHTLRPFVIFLQFSTDKKRCVSAGKDGASRIKRVLFMIRRRRVISGKKAHLSASARARISRPEICRLKRTTRRKHLFFIPCSRKTLVRLCGAVRGIFRACLQAAERTVRNRRGFS